MAQGHLECELGVSRIVREPISNISATIFVLIHYISYEYG